MKDLGQFEKFQQIFFSEKEGEAISAIRKTVIHDAEKLGLVSISEAKFGKKPTMDQELDICNRVYEIAFFTHEEGVCHNQEVQCEQAALHSNSTLHCKEK